MRPETKANSQSAIRILYLSRTCAGIDTRSKWRPSIVQLVHCPNRVKNGQDTDFRSLSITQHFLQLAVYIGIGLMAHKPVASPIGHSFLPRAVNTRVRSFGRCASRTGMPVYAALIDPSLLAFTATFFQDRKENNPIF